MQVGAGRACLLGVQGARAAGHAGPGAAGAGALGWQALGARGWADCAQQALG